MLIKGYSENELRLIKKYISCDALLLIICDAIARKKPLSVVRLSDGERSIMKYSIGQSKAHYLNEEKWLKEYGLMGADLKKIGEDLFKASQESDYLCANISGFFNINYGVHDLIQEREVYAEAYYGYVWKNSGRIAELFKENISGGVVTRKAVETAERLKANYNFNACETAVYDSWMDRERVLDEIGNMKSHLILCAGGASIKYLCVEAAKIHNKVVLDAGSALTNIW